MDKIVNLFERLVLAIEKLADAAVAPAAPAAAAPAAAAPKKAPAKKDPPAPAAPATPPAPPADDDLMGGSAPVVTLEMVQAVLAEALPKKDKAKLKEIINTIGNAPNVTAMDPSKYAAVHTAILAL